MGITPLRFRLQCCKAGVSIRRPTSGVAGTTACRQLAPLLGGVQRHTMATKQTKQTKQTNVIRPEWDAATADAARDGSYAGGALNTGRPAVTPVAAPVAPVAAPAKGLQAVTLTGKLYRTAAKHNQDWYAALTAAMADALQHDKPMMPAIAAAGVPAHFVGYCVRRGYLQGA